MDADRLKALRRGVLRRAGGMAQRLADHRRQFTGARQRPGSNDRPRDAARLTLVAIMIEDVGDLALVGAVEPVGGAFALLRHAHVERAVGLKGKAACPAIDLHRRYADVDRKSTRLTSSH